MKKIALWLFAPVACAILVYTIISKQKSINQDGEKLAKVYCSSCHEFPEPSLLPKSSWINHVLPEMGLRMGIGDKNTLLTHMSLKLFDQLNNLGVYPNTNSITEKEWGSIVKFYAKNAPVELPEIKKQFISTGSGHFTKKYFYTDTLRIPNTSMVKFAPNKNEIWMATGYKEFKKYTLSGIPKKVFRTPSPVVDAIEKTTPLYLSIGNMQPNEDRNGRLFELNEQGTRGKVNIDSLHRPVQAVQVDIDLDGIKDLIVLEYGYITGQVRLVNGKTNQTMLISKQPGARNLQIKDVDKDGYPDLLVLFAQAKEQVSLFRNLGGKNFKEEVVLGFPSVYGSSYVELADMNNDGYDDLIISFGDNADYSIIKKNYHGVAIYLNDGKYRFKKNWFYPTCGATKTLSGDFDNDGDIDMAMIAFFADSQKNSSFLYFEQQTKMVFNVSTLGVPQANWLVMDANDMDGDGDKDIILGNFNMTKKDSSKLPALDGLLLKNETVTRSK